ncbi:hypothetical protein ON010_g9437 [Phytophthora cinnamomi]|nr:hypothetical protein ON010_g9437 [Phytophthora cinnamomi]
MWRRIAAESNKYYNQHVNDRVDRMFEKQVARDDTTTREAVMLAEAKKHKRIQPEEILHIIGLLIARTLCPHKRRFADHWQRSSVGAVPKGTFGRYMSKARFGRVMQNLHFTDNTDPKAATDRAWKVRSVVDQLQSTFAAGYKVPPVLAFDESMIPSQSRFNITRQFMKDKPHKWGTKLFMTCCADTAYCFRRRVSRGGNRPVLHVDTASTAAAEPQRVPHRHHPYEQKGFPPALITDEVKRPADTPRGTAVVALAKAARSSRPCCGGTACQSIGCLQEAAPRWRPAYYKTIFLGLIDMGIVNAFIVYRWARQRRGDAPADHAKFLEQLQMQLFQVSSDDFLDEIFSPSPSTPSSVAVSGEYKLTEFPEWTQVREGIRKRPQHQCKRWVRSERRRWVSAVLPGSIAKRAVTARNACHQIWHIKWKNGDESPRPRVGRDIQMRGLGKKRRRRSSGDAEEEKEDGAAEEAATAEEDAEGEAAEEAAEEDAEDDDHVEESESEEEEI